MEEDSNQTMNNNKQSSEDLPFVDKVKVNLTNAWTTTKIKTNQGIDWTKRSTISLGQSIKKNTILFGKWLDRNNAIQLILALALSSLGIYLSLQIFDINQNVTIWMYVLIGLGIIGGIALWIFVATRYLGKMLYFIVEHKWVRKVFAGGSFSYFEFQNDEDYTLLNRFTEPIGIMITSLIAFLGLSTASIGIVRVIVPTLDTTSPILWGILAVVTPILGTVILPIAWTLTDVRIKAWNEKNQTTWMVSTKFKRRLNSFITIGAVASNLRSNVDGSSIGDQIDVLIGILRIGAIVMFISIGFFIIFYFVWYRTYLRRLAVKNLDLKSYEVTLVEHDVRDSRVFQQVKLEEEMIEEEGTLDETMDETTISEETDIKVDETEEIIETIDQKSESMTSQSKPETDQLDIPSQEESHSEEETPDSELNIDDTSNEDDENTKYN